MFVSGNIHTHLLAHCIMATETDNSLSSIAGSWVSCPTICQVSRQGSKRRRHAWFTGALELQQNENERRRKHEDFPRKIEGNNCRRKWSATVSSTTFKWWFYSKGWSRRSQVSDVPGNNKKIQRNPLKNETRIKNGRLSLLNEQKNLTNVMI